VFGHPSSVPSALRSKPFPRYNCDDYVSELKERLQTAHYVANKNLIASKVQSKDYYDKGTEVMKIEVGDKVLLYDEAVRWGRSLKFSSQWIGPYEVVEVNKVNATIRKGCKLIKGDVNRLKHSIEVGRVSGEHKHYVFCYRWHHIRLSWCCGYCLRWLYCPATVTWSVV
jgi:hypothetical protein